MGLLILFSLLIILAMTGKFYVVENMYKKQNEKEMRK